MRLAIKFSKSKTVIYIKHIIYETLQHIQLWIIQHISTKKKKKKNQKFTNATKNLKSYIPLQVHQ